MEIIISNKSALEYWRYWRINKNEKITDLESRPRKSMPDSVPNSAEICDVLPTDLSYPLNILVGNQNAKWKSKIIKARVYTGPTPKGCFIRVSDRVAVCAPSFCFYQMACELPLIKLIELGFEFCGSYSLPVGERYSYRPEDEMPDESEDEMLGESEDEMLGESEDKMPGEPEDEMLGESEDKMPGEPEDKMKDESKDKMKYANESLYRQPREYKQPRTYGQPRIYGQPQLTNLKVIKSFTALMKGVNGQKKALRASRYIADGSASPMETKLFMLLTLPYNLGGYGLPAPELNKRIDIGNVVKRGSERYNKGSGKSYYVCDLFWPKAKFAVEYDSDSYHTGADRIARDSKKRFDLETLGIKLITVTSRQIRNIDEFENIAKLIAKRLHKRLWYKEPKFLMAKRELRDLLFE